MANGHGGVRPGAGRKKKPTHTYQQAKRTIIEEVVTDDDWRKIVMSMVAHAKAGNVNAVNWLAPWIVGKVPDETKHTIEGGLSVEVIYVDSDPAEPRQD